MGRGRKDAQGTFGSSLHRHSVILFGSSLHRHSVILDEKSCHQLNRLQIAFNM